jgi:hypothetical protein
MRRRTLLVVLAGLAMVVAAGAVVFWPRPELITPENFERIRVGMSQVEVEAILGGPPGDYTTGEIDRDHEQHGGQLSNLHDGWIARGEVWEGNRIEIAVKFDESGNVFNADYWVWKTIDHGPLGNLRWLAERQWHRWFPE